MSRRNIEIFTAGCELCDEVVAQVRDAACDSCAVVVRSTGESGHAAAARRTSRPRATRGTLMPKSNFLHGKNNFLHGDPAARFRFVDSREPAVAGEVRFDMVDGDFTHRGERCTFEDLVAQLGLRDAALLEVAEIVHDIDLKDGKFARSEASGLEQLVVGICRAPAGDDARFERGFQLFDDLYRAYSAPGELQAPLPRRGARTGGKA